MKRIVKTLILIILLCPFMVNAASVKSVTLEGESTAKKGDYYNLKIKIKYDGIDKNSNDSMGIFELDYSLDYDRNTLIPTSITSSGYKSTLYNISSNSVGSINTVGSSNKSYLCKDEVLVCSDYEATISYYVEDTDKDEITIKLNNVDLLLLPVTKDVITESDVKEVIAKGTSKTIKIVEGTGKTKQVKSIVEDTKPVVETPKISTKKASTTDNSTSNGKKSTNNYLSSLTIEGYDIDFFKTINDYSIIVDENVEKVEVKYTLEDGKAKVVVHGNENLHKDNSVILITVTAENGSKNIYKVNVKKIRKVEETTNSNLLNKIKKINKKPVLIIAIVIVSLFLIVGIINFVKSRKIEKTMDKF